jgi:DNA-binding Lrp family transcriptional regulator
MRDRERNGRTSGPTHLELAQDIAPFDRKIIEMLQEDGRRPYISLARELQSTEKTVRRRVLELRDQGYLRITTVLDPRLLGFQAMALVGVTMEGGQPSSEIVATLAQLNQVDYVAATTGRFDVWVEFVCQDRQQLVEVVEREVRSLPGVAGAEIFPYLLLYYQQAQFAAGTVAGTGAPVSAATISIDDLDRQILGELALDGRIPYLAIGRKLGVTESKVRQRVKRMVSSGAVRIMAIANPQGLGYRSMAWLALTVHPATRVETIADVLARLQAVTYVAICAGRYDLFVEIACRDDDELLTVLEDQVRGLPGLSSIEVYPYVTLTYKPLLSSS